MCRNVIWLFFFLNMKKTCDQRKMNEQTTYITILKIIILFHKLTVSEKSINFVK